MSYLDDLEAQAAASCNGHQPADICDLDTERALLSAALVDSTAASVAASLPAAAWFDTAHARLAEVIRALDGEGHPVEPHTVASRLTAEPDLDNVGGLNGVRRIAAAGGLATSSAHYATLLSEQHQLRSVLAACHGAAEAVLRRNLPDAMETLGGVLDGFTTADEAGDIGTLLPKYLELLQARERGETNAVPTGMYDLDKIIGGLHPGNLAVIGARTGMGKTAALCQLTLNLAQAGARVLFVSLEMPWPELLDRWVGNWARVNTHKLRLGDLGDGNAWGSVTAAMDRLAGLGVRVAKPSTTTVPAIRAEARQHKADVILVDYLQLVRSSSGRRNNNRENDVAEVSRSLKHMAIGLEVPVVAAAQLNRNLESRVEKRPELSDLRDSGQIEQDSDVVVMVYREGAYENDVDPADLELIVRKNRHGELDTAHMVFVGPFQQVVSRVPESRLRSM